MTKRTTVPMIVLAAIALAWAAPAFAGTIPASIVPEGARWIAHMDMEKFVATELYGLLEKDGKFQIKSRDLDRKFKIDFPKDVKGVTVFSLGPDDKNVVFAVQGKLDKAGIIAMVEADKESAKETYGAYTLYSSGSDEYGAFIKDDLVVFSEGKDAILKVLDTAGGKAKTFAGTPLHAALKEVPSGAFLSGVLPDLSGLGKEISQSKVLDKASGLFFLAQEKKATLLVRLQVTAESPESAKNMADIIQGLIAMVRLGGDDPDAAKVMAVLDGLQVKLDGKILRLDFERPSKDVVDLLSQGGHGIPKILD